MMMKRREEATWLKGIFDAARAGREKATLHPTTNDVQIEDKIALDSEERMVNFSSS